MGFIVGSVISVKDVTYLVSPSIDNGRQISIIQGLLTLPKEDEEDVTPENCNLSGGIIIPFHEPISLLDNDFSIENCFDLCKNIFPGTVKKVIKIEDSDDDDDEPIHKAFTKTKEEVKKEEKKHCPCKLTLCSKLSDVSVTLDIPDSVHKLLDGYEKKGNTFIVCSFKCKVNMYNDALFSLAIEHKQPFSPQLYVPACSYHSNEYVLTDEEEDSMESFYNHTIFSVNTDHHTGGATNEEKLNNMKKRFASGSFMDIVPPKNTIIDLQKYVKRLCSIKCLRQRKIIGNHSFEDRWLDDLNTIQREE